jgi:transcriptional regulator with XRE-family HTH domain
LDAVSNESKRLGQHIRKLREAKGLSVRGLAGEAKVDFSWLARLERGLYESPDARNLYRLARALDIEVASLHKDAGYGEGLPGFAPYLRARYDLPEEAVAQLEAHFELINQRYRREKEDNRP